MKYLSKLFIVFIFLSTHALAQDICYVVVKKGDTLSQILNNFGIKRVFERQVQISTDKNYPTILKKGDLIYPGSVLGISQSKIVKNHDLCLTGLKQTTPEQVYINEVIESDKTTQLPQTAITPIERKPIANWRLSFIAGSTWSRLDGMEKKKPNDCKFLK